MLQASDQANIRETEFHRVIQGSFHTLLAVRMLDQDFFYFFAT